MTNTDYLCVCPPNRTGKNCRATLSCHANVCHNGGTCFPTGRSIVRRDHSHHHHRHYVPVSGIRCECPESFNGDYCQYKRLSTLPAHGRSVDEQPQVEYKQFDAETLAVITNLAGGARPNHAPRVNPLTESMSMMSNNNHSQFVFCLTNPCENGGTCFVTNTATTKVSSEERSRSRLCMSRSFRASVFVAMASSVITARLPSIIQPRSSILSLLVIVHPIHA